MQITKADVDFALAPSPWDLGNQVLYTLCHDHPLHDREDAIIAKVWLIGRSYAAAIERRKIAEDTSDVFYETTVVNKIRDSKLDDWLGSLPKGLIDPWTDLAAVVTVHKQLTDLIAGMTGLDKRSLASKYLHFHRPDLFFLYDTRAKAALAKVTPSILKIARVIADEADAEYLTLARRCQWVRDDVSSRYNVTLTPRQVDKMLLRITGRIHRARSELRGLPGKAALCP